MSNAAATPMFIQDGMSLESRGLKINTIRLDAVCYNAIILWLSMHFDASNVFFFPFYTHFLSYITVWLSKHNIFVMIYN